MSRHEPCCSAARSHGGCQPALPTSRRCAAGGWANRRVRAGQARETGNATALCISPTQRQSGELFRMAKAAIVKAMPDAGFPTDNRLSIELPNGSRLISLPGDPGTVRELNASLVLLDEAQGLPDGGHELFAAVRPMLATTGGRMLVLGTPLDRAGPLFDRAHSLPRILAVPHKVSQRLLLLSDIFRGRTQVAFDLGQVPLNRSHRCRWPPVASQSFRMMRSADFSSPLIFGGLRRLRVVRMVLGIFAVGDSHVLKQLPIQFRTALPGPLIRVQSFSTIHDGLSVPSA